MVDDPAPSPDFDARRIAVNQAAERLFHRPCSELDAWLTGERLRLNAYGTAAQAAEIVVASLVVGVVGQVAPSHREAAAIMFLNHGADHVQSALEATAAAAPPQTTEAGHG